MNDEQNFQNQNQPFKVELYTVVAVIFFVLAAMSVKFFQTDKVASFHEEIFPSDAIRHCTTEIMNLQCLREELL